jgi:two-component system sensor histidine kinase KdpD
MRQRIAINKQERLDLLLATAGHDMRGPLGGVKAAASILASDGYVLQPEESRALAADIVEEVDRLSILIDNLLDIQRLRAERLNLATGPVRIQDAIAPSISRFRSISGRVLVSVDPDLTMIDVDICLLQRVLANLISNALAVSPEDERVSIRARRESDGIRIAVVDHGPGIATRDRERIFRPFVCTETSNSGSGLGLALVARLVAAMSGKVLVSDTQGGGTTVTIFFPD